jgi:hypothetical protein
MKKVGEKLVYVKKGCTFAPAFKNKTFFESNESLD